MNMAKYIFCAHEFYQKFLKVVFKKAWVRNWVSGGQEPTLNRGSGLT